MQLVLKRLIHSVKTTSVVRLKSEPQHVPSNSVLFAL